MNPEMMKGQIRSVLIAVGGLVAGWLISRGWISESAWTAIVNSPVAAALATMAAGFIWSAMTHTHKNAVASVAAMPGTIVSPDGKTITIVERDLATAAKDAATNAQGV